jgi:hypothetical protein
VVVQLIGEDLVEEDNDPVLESLIDEAHDLYDFSIFEVMDYDDRASGILAIVEHFGPQPTNLIDRGFEILQRTREHNSN